MSVSEVKVISNTNIELLEKAIANFIAKGNAVEDMKFNTSETKDGILYSVLLMLNPRDSSAQV